VSKRQTFEEWWKVNQKFWVGSSRPAEEAARVAWTAGYRQHDSDIRRALQAIEDGEI
jgi:hypothetical protein